MFDLPPLEYNLDALEPYISEQTMDLHYNKHHRAYVDNLNRLIIGTEMEDMDLPEIVVATYGDERYVAIFNNAGQTYNHNIFWQSMKPNGGAEPKGELEEKIKRDFGSYDNFKEEFKKKALSHFGSGWTWLAEKDGKLTVMTTANGDNPITRGYLPIVGLDVWEHAYYLDYQNKRGDFIDAFLEHLVNWK